MTRPKPKGFESCMPCEGGEAVLPANEVRLNYIAASLSTWFLKIVRPVDGCR